MWEQTGVVVEPSICRDEAGGKEGGRTKGACQFAREARGIVRLPFAVRALSGVGGGNGGEGGSSVPCGDVSG